MIRKSVFLLFISVLFLAAFAIGSQSDDKAEIAKTVETAYRDGLFNVGDADMVRSGFHPVFVLIGRNGDEIWQLPIEKWIERMENDKKEGKVPRKEKVSFQFPLIDICGDAAVVKVAFFIGESQTYTDYLLLYRFGDGWKIVSKIYHSHPKPEK